jgi:glyoxylase-like metal-dependent hydrolase (beta-lactamase superfamily II)
LLRELGLISGFLHFRGHKGILRERMFFATNFGLTTIIELTPPFPGYEQFFGPWLHRGNFTYLVDVGPASCSQQLVSVLREMGVDEIDYVFLTHIHIDHIGGLSKFLSAYPKASIVCHERVVNDLIDPSHLWAASKKVLGAIAENYGGVLPVPRERLIPHSRFSGDIIQVVETPGHAAHHLSFLHESSLFVGEAAGLYQEVPGGREYHRPATPPRFFFDDALASVEKLLELGDVRICYAHYGMLPSSQSALAAFKKQLLLWREVACHVLNSYGKTDMIELMIQILLERDINLWSLEHMGEQAKARENDLMRNSVRGFLGCFKEKRNSGSGC